MARWTPGRSSYERGKLQGLPLGQGTGRRRHKQMDRVAEKRSQVVPGPRRGYHIVLEGSTEISEEMLVRLTSLGKIQSISW